MPLSIPELARATRRAAAQQAVSRATDRLAGVFGPLDNIDRVARLFQAAWVVDDLAHDDAACRSDLEAALVECLAEGQAWLEDLTAEDAR